MAKVKINFASLTDAQAAAPTTGGSKSKSTGFDFSSLADSDVATPIAEPSKKKVDTGLSGQENSTVGVYKPLKVAVPKATEDDDSIWDNLAGFASTIKNSLSPAMRTLPVNLLSGGVTFATNLVTGVIKGAISEEDFKKDPYLRDIVDTIEKPSKDLMEAASNVNKAVQPQIELAKRQARVKEEYMNMPISEVMTQDVEQGIRKLGVAALSQIPQVIGLAMTGGGNKARTFIAGATLGTSQAIQEEYEKDKDVSGVDIAQSAMKGVIEGLTEMIFDTDLKSAQNIGKAIIDVTMDGGKKAIKDVIEKVGKEEARDIIVRNYKDVVKNGLKGMGEEALEEVIATGASFVVDAIDSGKLNVKDYKKLGWDLLDASMLGASIGGPMSGLSAIYTKKNLTEEQKANVSRFQEVAKDKTLSPEIRQIAKNRVDEIVNYDSDLIDKEYNRLSALPLNSRIAAFGILSKIDSAKEDALKIKDITLLADNRDIIEGYKKELESIFDANKPSAEEVEAEAPKQATPEDIKAEQDAYQEELAKAQASFNVTMGVPTEPMKFTPGFSVKAGKEDIAPNNEFTPSPNYPLEVQKQEGGKRVQFTTKTSPDALLEADVYTVNQRGSKFATILSTKRNGVQEYYVPELENDKPFSNLDDAKFAVQEKLTGVLVSEKERSGIDRLRADKSMPKTDIVVKNDDGQDVILDPKAKKSIVNAVKAFKSVSSAPVYLYKNTEDFKKGVAKEIGEDSDALEAAGKVGGGFFTNAKDEDSIHINLANISETTVAHELFHGTVVNVARQNPSAFAAMRDAIINKLGDSDLINTYDEKGKLVKMSAKEYLDLYSKQYSPEKQAQEFLSELTGLLATDMAKLKDATIWETIKLAIRNLVKTAGIDIPIFDETANINDTVKFFNDLSKSLKTGKDINLGKLKITNEKQTTEQGAAVQATNGESQIAEEDAGLRDTITGAVKKKQRRSGNPIKKKDRPPSKEGVRALAIEPVNPSDYVYQYFAKNGQVLRGNKDSNEKDALFSLFSKGRQGLKKEATKELQDRVNMIDNRENGALSISEIAEKLFAEYQQATKGDVGIDVNTPYDYMDFRNAVENAILGYKSGKAMAIAMLESKNQATEEDAMALTEDEEFDKLRIQAEADAMGMTYEEFKAKLAEFEGNPTIGAIEDAYAQALDMINDEDMAKLYELSDEDVAKIDELMADLDDNTGKLNDKLAEQKKIVRDLEAKRKKIVAAIEKAGKETQLDITGKSPIQEQLFGADTKSLTDNLNAIDTQLAAAKADVADTQSAIDFQERGTVDMFKEEAPAIKTEESTTAQSEPQTGEFELISKPGETIFDTVSRIIEPDVLKTIDSYRKEAKKTNSTFEKRDEEYIRLSLRYDLLNAVGAYLQKGDKLVDAKVRRSVRGFDLTATVLRDGKEYNFRTTSTPAGGYNIQRFHYRYLINTDVPRTMSNNFDSIKNKMRAITASNKLEKEIDSLNKSIKSEQDKIESNKNMTDKEALKDWFYKDITWETIVKRGADKNYDYDKNAFEKSKEESRQYELGKRDRNIRNSNIRIKSLEATLKKTQAKLDKLFSDFPELAQIPATQQPSTPAGEVTKPIVDETEPVSNTDKIEDYGEKIGGAKKDLVKKALDSYDMGIEVNYRNAKYAQLLPAINYNALIKEGTLTQDKAIVIDIVRSKVSTRGSKWYNDAWVDEMISTRQLISNILNDDVDVYDLIENLSIEDSAFDSTFNAMKAIDFPQSGLSLGNYFIKEFGPSNFAVVNGYRIVGGRHNTFDEAVEFLSDILEGNKSKTKETKFSVYQNRVTKEIYIGKKAGSDVIKIMDGFNNSDEAFAYINENRPALEQVWKEMRQNPDERRGENRTRVGEDYRKGRNVSGEEFGKTFGFRGVEFGNWVNNKERQESVNDAYDALMDLSTALGISPKSISLGGKLGLAFGARGSGKAMAHYERGKTVINLTKTKGAGSLAHEWWHALDNYFASPKSDKYMTEGTKDSGINARQEIKDAFSNIVNTINKETAIKTRSSKLDKARTDSYWSTDIEMTARSFESFVVSRLAETGNSNDYLANFKELTDWSNGGSVSAESYPYPSPEEKDVINKAYQELFNTVQEKQEGAKTILFQKQGISVAPITEYKYQMNEMFKDPQRLTKDIEAKYDIRTTLRERGESEGKLLEVERAITDQIVTNALSKVGVATFKTIGAIENAPLFKAGTGETVRLKQALTGWAGYTGNGLRAVTLKAIQGNNKYAASTGRVAASLIGNLAKSNVLQEQRALRSGSQLDANNSIAMLSKGLNGMIGFDERALMRVHSLLDPEAFEILGGEDVATSPADLSLQELRLYNTLRDINDFIHEWHFQNEFIDAPTYEKHKGKYFARMYEEIERKEFADLHEAIDKMPSGVDFRMFKERKDFSEVELTLMNDPIYITSKRLATMLHNKATLEFCNAMANDPSYKIYKNKEDLPENNIKGFKLLDSRGGGKRYGELTNKYVPLALYEELRGTTFANEWIAKSYDALRGYDGFVLRQFFKKTKTLYNPTTRLGNITTNFAFAWLAGVDPFTMMKNRVKAKDSLDSYDDWAKELAIAGVLGTDVIVADLSLKKDSEGILGFLQSKGLREDIVKKAQEVDKYLMDSYGRTDDVAKISLYRSLVEDYGKSKQEAIRIVGESMQNYATVGKAYQYFSKVPVFGNPFVKFSSDMARIVANGFANRPLYMASFLGMMYGVARLLSGLSGEPEDEREARESRAFIPKIPLGFTDIPLTWKVGKYEVNAARFISPYYVYDAGYRSNTVAELTKFAPIQLSYDNKVGFAADYAPVMSDPFIAPLVQTFVFDKDFRGLPIADPNGSKYTKQTVSGAEAAWNRFNYLGYSYASPVWGYVANLYSAATGQGDLYGRRRDIPSAILNSVIKVQEMETSDVKKAVINQVKYIDSEYKQIKTDITSRRNDDVQKIQEIIASDATESQKEKQILNVKVNYSNYVEEMIERMQELKTDREVPMDRLYKIQNPKKND